MKKLSDTLYKNIKFDFSLLEEYIETRNDISRHSTDRIRHGRLDTGSSGATEDELKNTIRKADSVIEHWMLNNPDKKTSINLGIRNYTKDGYLIPVVGNLYNFNFTDATYNFKFFTSNKYYLKHFYEFKDVDLIIEIKNDKVTIKDK